MIRKAGQELVLYYNPEASSKVMKLKEYWCVWECVSAMWHRSR